MEKMLLRAQLSATSHHTHHPPKEPYSICVFLSEIDQVRSRLSLIHASLGKLNRGGFGLTSLINVWSLGAFFHHFMFHLYYAHCATLVPDLASSFSSSNATSTNVCCDLSCSKFLSNGDISFSCRKCSGS